MGWPLALAVGFAAPGFAQTLPQGGNVVGGSGTIQQTAPNQLTINQSTQKLAIDWQSFSVGTNDIVRFEQPSTSAVALNRVLNGDPSQIYGQIQANGQVVIMSPNGIVFGPNSRVDVNALVATTANIATLDFMAGKLLFDQASSDANARVVNQGVISVAQGGFAVLAAASVSNQGQIIANGGTVVLGGTKTFAIDFHGDGLLKFAATGLVDQKPAGADALVENAGSIEANGGRVLLTARAARSVLDNVINTTGIVVAKTASLVNGEIVIDGGDAGIVSVNGTLDASGRSAGESGGTVKILGEKVGLFENARVDASGAAGGGTVLVGGNYLGKGPEANAKYLYMDARAIIDASAVSNGDGGRVILWSDLYTSFQGTISARGGASGGDGGFVETSSKDNLQVQTGRVDASAVLGTNGRWLLDPRNVTIGATTTGGTYAPGPPGVFTPTDNNATINVATIIAALNAGTSVTITTGGVGNGTQNGDITVGSPILKTTGASATLTLNAAGSIFVNNGILSESNALNVNLWAGGNINVIGAITTNNGAFATAGFDGAGLAGGSFQNTGAINAGVNNISILQTGAIAIGGTLTSSSQIALNANGATTQTAAIIGGGGLVIAGTSTGSVALNHAANAFSWLIVGRYGTSSNISLATSGTLSMAASTLGTGTFSLSSVGFTQSGAITQISSGGGTVAISGGTGNVTLSQANSFAGAVSVTGAAITVSAAQTATGAGSISLTAGGTITIATGGSVATTGTGNIALAGANNVWIDGSISTGAGAITIWGNAPGGSSTAGTAAGTIWGVQINATAMISSGAGSISIVGKGATDSAAQHGIVFWQGGTVQSTSGDISLLGRGGSGASGGMGIAMVGGTVQSTSGNIYLTGYATANADGIQMSKGADIHSDTGDLILTGVGAGASGYGFKALYDGTAPNPISKIGTAAGTGDIDIIADSMFMSSSALRVQSSGIVVLRPFTSGATVGIGGGAGTLQLSGDMSFVDAALLVVGDVETGAIAVGTGGYSNANGSDLVLWGDSIALNGNVTLAADRTLTLYAEGSGVSQTSGSTVTATNLILRGGGNFALDRGGAGYNNITNVAADVTSGTGSGAITLATGAGGISSANALSDIFGMANGIATQGGLGWNAANGLTQTSAGDISVLGSTTLIAQNGAIDLAVANNSFGGQVSAWSKGGGISLRSQSLWLGTVTSGGDVVLTNAANEFGGAIAMTNASGGISIANKGNTVLAGIASNGVLNISVTGGTLSQVSGSTITTTGNATFALAGSHAMTLANTGNNFGGNLALSGSTGTVVGTIAGTVSVAAGTFVVNGQTYGVVLPSTTNDPPTSGTGGTSISKALSDAAPVSQIQAAANLTSAPTPTAVSVVADVIAQLAAGPAPTLAGAPVVAAGPSSPAESGEVGPAVSPVGVVVAPPAPPPAIVLSSGPPPVGPGAPPLVPTAAPPPPATVVVNVGGATALPVNGGVLPPPSSNPRSAFSGPLTRLP
jgi:filamentous hemagglutinin family protein